MTLADLESATRLEPVGAVPSGGVRRRRRLAVAAFPYSPAAEGYRRVAAELLRRGVANEIKVLAVVSPDRREGRSTMTANLAYALANEGRRVAVISGDLRRPAAEDIFHIARSDGLAELLEGDDRDPVTKLWSVTSRLVVMPAGSPNRNPADLLASPTLRRFMSSMRELDWLILIDTPPARSLADALILAGVADAVLLVARSGVSRARALEATAAGLDRANHRMVGAALVDVTPGVLARRNLRRPGRGGGGDGYPVPKAPLYDGTLESRWQDEERKVLGASSSKDESA
jgi:capsular exopolysaccharide synthesis family protein